MGGTSLPRPHIASTFCTHNPTDRRIVVGCLPLTLFSLRSSYHVYFLQRTVILRGRPEFPRNTSSGNPTRGKRGIHLSLPNFATANVVWSDRRGIFSNLCVRCCAKSVFLEAVATRLNVLTTPREGKGALCGEQGFTRVSLQLLPRTLGCTSMIPRLGLLSAVSVCRLRGRRNGMITRPSLLQTNVVGPVFSGNVAKLVEESICKERQREVKHR